MAVQFNLLPDVKLEYDRQQRTKRLVVAVSSLTVATVVALFVISFVVVDVLQKKLLTDASNDITKYSNNIKKIEKSLTIQNQLNSLPGLHQKKHMTSLLFDYLPEVTPTKVNIGKLDLDTGASTLTISGTADSVESINKFVDTLKFTDFTTAADSTKKPAFTNVILSKVDRNDKDASYTIDTGFDTALFDAAQKVTLVVPQETTTRSVINTPGSTDNLFNGQTGKPATQTQGTQ
jgi:Tfp pilus assembly protein PilN